MDGFVILSLILFSLIFPNPSFAKRERSSKKAEAAQTVKKSKPAQPPQTDACPPGDFKHAPV